MLQSSYLPWRGYFDFIDDVEPRMVELLERYAVDSVFVARER